MATNWENKQAGDGVVARTVAIRLSTRSCFVAGFQLNGNSVEGVDRSPISRWVASFLMCLILVILTSLLAVQQTAKGADETVVRWSFSRANDLNFDNYPDGWKRTFDQLHPRYLKLEIVPHNSESELSIRTFDASFLEGWLTVRSWAQRIPFQRLTVQATPSILPVVQYGLRSMPPLPPSLTDMFSNRYLRAEVDGGAIMATSPTLPVDLDYSYRLQARIRTQDLVYNRAWLEMVFADQSGKPIEVLTSQKFGQTQNWTQFEVGPKSPPRQATSMWLNLRYESEGRADLSGWVGFDDLVITRFPRIRMETDRELALYESGAKPKIRCVVSGIDGEGRAIDFRILDDRGNTIQTVTRDLRKASEADNDGSFPRALVLSSSEIGGIANWQVPELGPGFYRIQGSLAGVDEADFVVEQTMAVLGDLPDEPGPFGWAITGKTKQIVAMRELPEWLKQNRVQWFKYSCWIAPKDNSAADDLAWLAGRLQDRKIQMVGVLDSPPSDLLADLSASANDPAAILFRDSTLWQPILEPVMTRLTSGIHWWQLGSERDFSFLGRTQLKQTIAEIHSGLQGFGQPIRVAINWPWLEQIPPTEEWSWHTVVLSERTPFTAAEIDAYFSEVPLKDSSANTDAQSGNSEVNRSGATTGGNEVATTSGSLFSTASFRPEEFAKEIADDEKLAKAETQRPWIILEPMNKHDYSRADRIRDLVTRMIAVRRQKIPAAFVANPFDPDLGILRADGSPDEMLLPWRTAAGLLAGMYPVGSLELPNESQNVLMANANSAMLVVWNDQRQTEKLYLGDRAKQIDAFGRDVPVGQVLSRGFDVQEIQVTEEPSFVVGIDRTAALWRLGVRLDRERIDSLLGREQTVNLIFQNPATVNINGTVKIQTPESWNVTSSLRPIAIDAFRRRQEPITIMLRGDATIGRQMLEIDFELDGDQRRRFTVWRPLEVGPEDIKLDVSTRLLPDGRLIIRQEITNTAGGAKQFDCYVYAPSRRRQRRSVTVEPGQTMVQEFVWFDGESLLGEELLLRAEQQGGERTLNFRFKATK